MTKKFRILMLSCVTMLIALALVVAATFALFTAEHSVTNHLQAGEMKLELWRTSLTKIHLVGENGSKDGFLHEWTDGTDVNFTQPQPQNIFGLTKGEVIVPGCNFEAEMELRATGDVAFTYWLEIVLDSEGQDVAKNAALAEQLKITVRVGGTVKGTPSQLNGGSIVIGSASAPVGTASLGANGAHKFSVEIEFLDKSTNNAAQNGEVSFDLIVHATQTIG